MCDDYVARVELISHMLNHALNSNSAANNDTAVVAESAPDPPEKVNSPENVDSPENENLPEKKVLPKPKSKSASTNTDKKGRAPNYCRECDKKFADSGGYKYHINSFHKKIKK